MASIANIPSEDVLDAIVPQEIEETEQVETEGQEGSEGEPSENLEAGQERTEDGQEQKGSKYRGVSPQIGKIFEELKTAKDPRLEPLKAAIYDGVKAKQELAKLTPWFPNGVADVLQLKEQLDQLPGGAEDLEQLGNDIRMYQELDSMLESGDPRVLENLSKIWPDAVKQIGPAIFEKLRDVYPDWFNKNYAGMVIAEVNAENVPQSLVLLRGYLEPVLEMMQDGTAKQYLTRALGIVTGWGDWLKRLGQASRAEVKPIDRNANGNQSQANNGADATEKKELELFQREVNSTYKQWEISQLKTGIDKILATKKANLTPHQHRRFAQAVLSELRAKMGADKGHERMILNYERKRDKAGLERYLQSRVSAILKGAEGSKGLIATEYDLMFRNVKFGKGPANGDGNGNGNGKQSPGTGWTKISVKDKDALIAAGRIDWGKTTPEMRLKSRYIKKDGGQVYTD